ncbi:autotransporter outer membrane beta-barrel domain-containing protein [Bartonella sp. CM31XJBT]|uniref:autotransporter outer membrane beta-barrel domain-containing protein n=5 Tax=Bartonella TaxID=773 RepID=UPI003857D187
MYKTSLLSCTAAAAIILFNIQFSAHAETLVVSGGKQQEVSDKTYETIHAKDGGKIIGKHLKIIVSEFEKTGVISEGDGSEITLKGETTIEKVVNGLWAKNKGKIVSKNLTIEGSNTGIGVTTEGLGSEIELMGETTIENFQNGIRAESGGKITGKDLTIILPGAGEKNIGVLVDALDSVVKLTGQTIIKDVVSKGLVVNKGKIVSENLTITGSQNEKNSNSSGVMSFTLDSTIELKGSTTIEKVTNGLTATLGGKIVSNNLTITGSETENSTGAIAYNNSMITLNGTTTIEKVANGLDVRDGATIKMIDGSIAASHIGAIFEQSINESTLEDVTISSGKDDILMDKGIRAYYSTVTLNNVTVTQALTGISANGFSIVKISKGTFNGKTDGVYAQNYSRITLNGTEVISSYGYGLHADGQKSNAQNATIIMTGGKVNGKDAALFAEKGGKIDATNVALTTEGTGSGAFVIGDNSTIQLHGDTIINNTLSGLDAGNGGKIISENLSIIGGEALEGPDNERTGIWTSDSGSEVRLMGKTTIQNVDEGFYADGGSQIISGDLIITGGESKTMTVGVNVAETDSLIKLNGKTIIQNFDVGLTAENNSTIKMTNGYIGAAENTIKNKIEAKKVALWAAFNGHIDVVNTSMIAGVAGLQFIALSNPDLDYPDDPQKRKSSEINLTNADVHAENGTGIFVGAFTNDNMEDIPGLSIGTVNLKNSEIHADVLLGDGLFEDPKSWKNDNYWNNKEVKAISNGTFTLSADQSILEGRANIAKDRNVHFDLKNNTKWTLKISKNEKDDDGNLLDIAQRSRSDISTLNLDNSSIIFNGPTEDHYQTLHIGSGKPDTQEVYNATGDAKIYFNTAWSDGAAINDQKTDRLLIHGDVFGNTSVYVTGRLEENNIEANTSAAANVRGLSLIQVSGKAEENSFKLVNGYTTRGGLPDMYTLRAYGPDSSQGNADIAQNLFDEKNENFWDFRLQPELLGSNSGSNPDPETNIPTVAPVPQTASYLVMPNALFYSGLTDMAKQNALLANIRTSVLGKEEEKQTGFFLYTYGNTGTLSSERGPLKYGYGADIRYAALQAGVTFAALEGQNTTTHFGLVGTYGRLSFTPKDMDDVSKSTLDKWSLTAYGSVQHNNGFYMDTLLSYGILKGDIGNAIIGKTAKLQNAKMLSISTTVGKEFATGMEGLTFEPQAQIAYQHLMFNTIEDADNFTVDMNNPSQWLIRVGGRLTKTISTENNRPMSFYGKVNLIKTFGDNGTIHIGRNFDLDPMGPAIEGGVGINAQLSHNFSLHGDVSYQQKLQKTGISGASFSGGIRYQF